jgi:hypothetical protein
MGLWAHQGDKKRVPVSNYFTRKHRPTLCHLDRSEAQWRDLCVDTLSWECFWPVIHATQDQAPAGLVTVRE